MVGRIALELTNIRGQPRKQNREGVVLSKPCFWKIRGLGWGAILVTDHRGVQFLDMFLAVSSCFNCVYEERCVCWTVDLLQESGFEGDWAWRWLDDLRYSARLTTHQKPELVRLGNLVA